MQTARVGVTALNPNRLAVSAPGHHANRPHADVAHRQTVTRPLVWQMTATARGLGAFGAKMLQVPAIDLMIDRDGLCENGIMSLGIGWRVPRRPGLEEIKWPGVFSGLDRAGCDGPAIIEHEDRSFEGSDDKIKRGFVLAQDVLRRFVK